MGHPLRWTIFCFIIYLVKIDKANCQFFNPTEICVPSSAELISTLLKELSPSARNQLVNTLLAIATNNGILPDFASLTPSSPPNDNYAGTPVNSGSQTLNFVPLVPTVCISDPIPITVPVVSAPLPNSQLPQTAAVPEAPPQNEFSNYFNSPQFVPVPSQPSLTDIVYSICTPTYVVPDSCFQISSPSPSPSLPTSSSPPSSTSSPPPSPSTSSPLPSSSSSPVSAPPSINNTPPTSSPSSSPTLPSSSLSSTPSENPLSQSIPMIETPFGCVEIITTNLGSQTNPFSSIFTNDSEMLPVNLEINLPALNVPEPRITIVTADRPAPYPIVKKSSSLKKILPLLLIAMLCNDRNNNGCSCNCNPNIVPIPYPIPMPMSSTVNCPFCGNSYNDDEDDEDGSYGPPNIGYRKRREHLDAWEEHDLE